MTQNNELFKNIASPALLGAMQRLEELMYPQDNNQTTENAPITLRIYSKQMITVTKVRYTVQ